MVNQVEQNTQEKKLSVVEWSDATGWTEEILFWLLAWIDVVEEKQGHTGYSGVTPKNLV